MRDEQTGSFWQQVSGIAISGPLAGAQLDLVRSDELTSKLWLQESPDALVLAPVGKYASKYEKAGWEKTVAKLRTVVSVTPKTLAAREIVFGIKTPNASRAFPQSLVLAQAPLLDTVGGEPIVFFVGSDGMSVRAFSREINGDNLEFFKMPNGSITDRQTQSIWNFEGCATTGTLKGNCLRVLTALKDYWFDWQNYHPGSTIYQRR